MAPLRIKRLDDDQDDARWNAFVQQHEPATFFHLSEWRHVLERSLRIPTCYLYAEDGSDVRGVLPLALMRRPLLGSVLLSTPLCVYGGAVADSPQIVQMLEREAIRLGEEANVSYVELRNGASEAKLPNGDATYFTFRRPLLADEEENLKAIPRKERAAIRKAIANGLHSRETTSTDTFFKLYARSMRDLGTPAFPRACFSAYTEIFGERCKLMTVYRGDTALCAVLSFTFRDQILPYYSGSIPQGRAYRAYQFMLWELMRRSAARGSRVFDFGRSVKGTGAYNFKINWGFEPEPLNYHIHLVRGRQIPDMTPSNPKYRHAIALWKRLPVPLANIFGRYLSRLIV